MRNSVAPVTNVTRLISAYADLQDTSPLFPKMGLIYGPVGSGKTFSTTKLSIDMNAVHVICEPVFTPTAMLNAMLREVGRAEERSDSRCIASLKEALKVNPRPIFVDECDQIYRKPVLMETLRSLHDQCSVPVVIIGESGSPEALQRYPQLHHRISQWVKFEPLNLADLALLARECCEVPVEEALLEKLLQATEGNMRDCSIGLKGIESHTRAQAQQQATAELWGDRPFTLQGVNRGRRHA